MIRSPFAKHDLPRSGLVKYAIGRAFLTVAGFETEGELPEDCRKAVMIAHPHTSNWDLPYMLATAWVYRVRLSWLGKHTVFKGWRGPLMRALGGIPVDRRAPKGQVGQAADRIEESERILLAVAPAGTRAKTDRWRSGFYHIANTAQVHVVMSYLDFGKKKSGVGGAFLPSGDIAADMDKVRAFYDGMTGLHPELATTIVVKEELADENLPESSPVSAPSSPAVSAPNGHLANGAATFAAPS